MTRSPIATPAVGTINDPGGPCPSPSPVGRGDGGTVHKRPQGTVRGRLGSVDADRAMAAFRDPPGGFHGVAAEARRRGKGGMRGQLPADDLDAESAGYKVRMDIRSIPATAEVSFVQPLLYRP